MTRPAIRVCRPGLRAFVVALLAFQVACADAPTGPASLRWLVNGEAWVAVLPPETLPNPSAWVPVDGAAPGAADVAARVRTLEAEADRSLSRGQLARSVELRRSAIAHLAGSRLARRDASIVHEATSAIDVWLERVEPTVALGDAPPIAAAYRGVAEARARAGNALASGDTAAAALELMSAAESIRAWSPSLIALRVLERAERRLASPTVAPENLERARHLVRSAREALRGGDAVRALQRALYALQMAGGHEVIEPAAKPR